MKACLQRLAAIGAERNEGAAGNVAHTGGAIGYVEYAYAKQNRLDFVRMINRDGVAVSPTSAAFQAAAARTHWAHAKDFYVVPISIRRRFLGRRPGSR
ncbi:MAG TPA: hypothetical protein VHX61_16880 [Rhizomicrobium sp.]|jgi:phosphate transport system substrate-binding protein|nr:hypothetical protein [Rhizomicrobium sp.]